jgi:hypothetical protein
MSFAPIFSFFFYQVIGLKIMVDSVSIGSLVLGTARALSRCIVTGVNKKEISDFLQVNA